MEDAYEAPHCARVGTRDRAGSFVRLSAGGARVEKIFFAANNNGASAATAVAAASEHVPPPVNTLFPQLYGETLLSNAVRHSAGMVKSERGKHDGRRNATRCSAGRARSRAHRG